MKYFRIVCSVAVVVVVASLNACEEGENPLEIEFEEVGLTMITGELVSPVMLIESPDNTSRLFVVDQPGQVYIMKDGVKLSSPFLDISNKVVPRGSAQDERGLLGMAFHPAFASNGRFFVYYSGPLRDEAPDNWNHTSYIAEYMVSAGNADMADAGSEKIVLAVDQPQSNHNAGMIAFGNDGNLYISLGDGGGGNDIGTGHVADWYDDNGGGNGQNTSENLLGSILRINVDSDEPYGIPGDNPFVGKEGRDEIYAFGFRNPYRFCFDQVGNIIAADAGQELYEEIDLVVKGGNYGWNVKEGRHCFDAENPTNPPADCPDVDEDGNELMDPVIEFKNSKSFNDGLGNVSVGGFVYQGDNISFLKDKYIFGVLTQDPDLADGAVFAADRSGNDWPYKKLRFKDMDNGELNLYVLGFGQDADGEVYVLANDQTGGKVFRIDP